MWWSLKYILFFIRLYLISYNDWIYFASVWTFFFILVSWNSHHYLSNKLWPKTWLFLITTHFIFQVFSTFKRNIFFSVYFCMSIILMVNSLYNNFRLGSGWMYLSVHYIGQTTLSLHSFEISVEGFSCYNESFSFIHKVTYC